MFKISITPFEFIYQTIGIIAMITLAGSFLFKSKKLFCLFQSIGCLLFGIQFSLVGAWAGSILDCISGIRAIVYFFLKNKKPRLCWFFVFTAIYIFAGTSTMLWMNEEWFIAVLIMLAQSLGTFGLYYNSQIFIRYSQVFFISLVWLFNSIYYFSIGGIICESLGIVTSIIFIVRYHLEKRKAAQN